MMAYILCLNPYTVVKIMAADQYNQDIICLSNCNLIIGKILIEDEPAKSGIFSC